MSIYVFKGRLCGYLCAQCQEPLANVEVKLYRVDQAQNVTALAVANPKETFVILNEAQVAQKESRLFARASTDAEGNFSFRLEQDYRGEAFEIDVLVARVPRQSAGQAAAKPRQFSITTLQPRYLETADGFVAAWSYCIPVRFWCQILAGFGVWTICGQVVDCKTRQPIRGVRVKAFDVDWLADDPLGAAATTDAAGRFIITYAAADFKQGTWINVELFGGPDIYFRIETGSGTALLSEPRSRGRAPDRENVGPCFCVELCIDKDMVPPSTVETLSVFNRIGGYNFLSEIDSASGGDGRTLADNRAFFSTLRLNGILAQTKNGNPLEYAFEVAAYDPVSDLLGPYSQIPLAQVAPTQIGTWEHYTGDLLNPVETKDYILNGVAGPGVLVPQVSPDGWVRVPQENNVFAAQGNFVPGTGGYPGFINLVSQSLRAFGSINESAVKAGLSATTGGTPLGRDFYFSLRMKVREAVSFGGAPVPLSEQYAGTCVRLAVMNTLYDHVAKNGSWVPHTENGQLCVSSLDIQELAGAGCTEISDTLSVKYTCAHPNLGTFSLSMIGPGGPYSFTPGGGGTPDNRFGTASNNFVLADLPDCAYLVKLAVNLLLTTGDAIPDPVWDEVAFCKNSAA